MGWSINFVGSESGQIQSVKLLQNMVSNRIPYPITHGIRMYSIQYLFTQGRGGGGRVEPERRGEGQQGRVQIPNLGLKYQHDRMCPRNYKL
jgi:hypothetical protein